MDSSEMSGKQVLIMVIIVFALCALVWFGAPAP